MKLIPKVKTVSSYAEVGTGVIENKLCVPGEYTPGKMPAGGFQAVWNFKNDQPNDYFTRKMSPTSGGGKKVY
jgi:cephalosporin hydroxylase